MNYMRKIRVGVFGLWMRAYLARIAWELDDVEVVAICDRDEKRV